MIQTKMSAVLISAKQQKQIDEAKDEVVVQAQNLVKELLTLSDASDYAVLKYLKELFDHRIKVLVASVLAYEAVILPPSQESI
jgi:fructoselysine-6-P-deglycase FrlB-like protein